MASLGLDRHRDSLHGLLRSDSGHGFSQEGGLIDASLVDQGELMRGEQ